MTRTKLRLNARSLIFRNPLHRRFLAAVRELRPVGGRFTGRSVLWLFLTIGGITATAVSLWTAGLALHALQLAQIERTLSLLLWLGASFISACALLLSAHIVLCSIRADWTSQARNGLLASALQLSHAGAKQFGATNLAQQLQHDIDQAAKLVVELPAALLASSLQLITWISVIAIINWPLSALIATLILTLLIPRKLVSLARQRAAAKRDHAAAVVHTIENQSLEHFRDIASLGAEKGIVRLHRSATLALQRMAHRERTLQLLQQYIVLILCGVAGMFVLGVGLQRVREGYLNTYELIIFSIFLVNFYWPLRFFAQMPKLIECHLGACDRVTALLNVPVRIRNQNTRPLAIRSGTVSFEKVSFSAGDEAPLLRELSIVVPGGQTIALVGPKGSGKSILARLLLRLDDPAGGRITIDEVDICTIHLESLRYSVGVLWEHTVVFPGTVRENLLLAAPGASDDELLEACDAARVTEIIARLPDGVNTLLGAGAFQVTPSDLRRFALAQLFLRNPAIVFAYEPPDTQADADDGTMAALTHLRTNRTCFIDAHRLQTIKSADSVLYFHGDGSTTLGRHQDLMELHATYRSTIQWQTRRIS